MENLLVTNYDKNQHLPELVGWKQRFGKTFGYADIQKYIFSVQGASSFREMNFDGVINPKTNEKRQTLVVLNATEIVGVVSFDKFKSNTNAQTYIQYIFLNPALQGKGLAKNVFKLAIEEFAKQNPDADYFYANIKHTNKPSQKLFEKLGFNKTEANASSKLVQMEASLNQITLAEQDKMPGL